MTSTAGTHRDHDPILISAAAAADVNGRSLTETRWLLARCADCRLLAADLRAIAAATRQVPPVRRPRGFTIDPGAVGGMGRVRWRRLLGAMGGPRFGLAAPVGGALTALGLAGMLLTTVPAVSTGRGGDTDAAGAVRVETDSPGPGTTIEEPAAVGPGAEEPGVDAAGLGSAEVGPGGPKRAGRQEVAGRDPGTTERGPLPTTGPTAAQGGTSRRTAETTLAVLSGSFLIVGLGLFGMRWTGRRLGGD